MQDIQHIKAQHQEIDEKAKKPTYPLVHKVAIAGGIGLLVAVVCLIEQVGSIGYFLVFAATLIAFNHGAETLAKGRQVYQHEVVPFLPERQAPLAIEEEKPQLEKPLTTTTRKIDNEVDLPTLRPSTTTMKFDDEEIDDLTVYSKERKTALLDRDVFTRPAPVTSVFPPFPEEDTLCLGKVYKSSRRFDPHFDAIFGQGVIIAATQFAGKSHILGRIIEQSGKAAIPAIVFDHKGEYRTVTELPFTNAIRVGGTPDCDLMFTEEHEEQLDQFISMIFDQRYQVIIDLPTYGPNWINRARIIAMLTRALMFHAEKKRLRHELLLPCLVLLDEAQLYIPENNSLLPPEAQENRATLSDLKNGFFSLVSNGRSNGYTIVFATQSLTYIAKWAIKSCQVQVYGRHVEKNDLDQVERTIDETIASREEIRTFPAGVAVVLGLTRDPIVVQFDKKESRDLSETPNMSRLRTTTTTNLERSFQNYQRQPVIKREVLPALRPKEVGVLGPAYPEEKTGSRPTHRNKYAKPMGAWKSLEEKGIASLRNFAEVMEMNKAAAYELLCEMDKLQLITWERKKTRGL